ncbi:MAG: hypothetical protein KGM17_08365 [Sphingomonadales bacterium]|nr:hypothetical protein [Sphingomonadales bacterium]
MPALFALALLAACQRGQPAAQAPDRHPAAVPNAAPSPTAAASPVAAPAPVAAPSAARDPEVVLAGWAAAVEARDWRLVRAYWGHGGSDAGLDEAAFAARWGALKAPRVTLGLAEEEGAAGSLFYDAPVMIADGKRRIAGHVVLRRVNDVDGASVEDLRWHIQSSTLAP